MPVILHPDECRAWLDLNLTDPEGLSRLFQPYPADLMEIRPVSQLVDSPKTTWLSSLTGLMMSLQGLCNS